MTSRRIYYLDRTTPAGDLSQSGRHSLTLAPTRCLTTVLLHSICAFDTRQISHTTTKDAGIPPSLAFILHPWRLLQRPLSVFPGSSSLPSRILCTICSAGCELLHVAPSTAATVALRRLLISSVSMESDGNGMPQERLAATNAMKL